MSHCFYSLLNRNYFADYAHKKKTTDITNASQWRALNIDQTRAWYPRRPWEFCLYQHWAQNEAFCYKKLFNDCQCLLATSLTSYFWEKSIQTRNMQIAQSAPQLHGEIVAQMQPTLEWRVQYTSLQTHNSQHVLRYTYWYRKTKGLQSFACETPGFTRNHCTRKEIPQNVQRTAVIQKSIKRTLPTQNVFLMAHMTKNDALTEPSKSEARELLIRNKKKIISESQIWISRTLNHQAPTPWFFISALVRPVVIRTLFPPLQLRRILFTFERTECTCIEAPYIRAPRHTTRQRQLLALFTRHFQTAVGSTKT